MRGDRRDGGIDPNTYHTKRYSLSSWTRVDEELGIDRHDDVSTFSFQPLNRHLAPISYTSHCKLPIDLYDIIVF
jgi:hypothetical protein